VTIVDAQSVVVKAAVPPAAPAKPQVSTPETNVAVQTVLLPPAPNVIKRNPNAISIPVDALDKGADFETRETSNVSVGSGFGVRRDPFTRRRKFHSGVDIKARWGDPIGASHAGTVSFVGWYHGYGNLVIVSHGGGVATHYAHLSSFDVEVGEHVERGKVLGRAGSTGRATSPHLHYEVRIDGSAVNPFGAIVLDAESPYFKQSRLAAKPAAPSETVEKTEPQATTLIKQKQN
jgi:murein DD-endopeptidase MepM/ murein hydrolase activator NlpD